MQTGKCMTNLALSRQGYNTMFMKEMLGHTALKGASGSQIACFSSSQSGPRYTRPLSPHLTIYKPGINMITSITFRATGIALGASFGLTSIGMILAGHPIEHYIEGMKNVGILPLVKFGVGFPLVYHWLGGIRHLVWDNVIGHDVEAVNQSSWALVGASVILGGGLAFVSFGDSSTKTAEMQSNQGSSK
eukprot:gb/GECG01006520.1/.p1 GENE.gb/GECG01006520.1/~~gb/GECG01006520.1/.p1  ORF type:complete len:189 (+),score=14.87 gb/GECG01006520.1/:1-567(+)